MSPDQQEWGTVMFLLYRPPPAPDPSPSMEEDLEHSYDPPGPACPHPWEEAWPHHLGLRGGSHESADTASWYHVLVP